ncbi:unnamed protein product [Adineta steineri]|uniref:G-protein coupled receptors family 1 profile domain-containing protein n=1 Tax=Adineta steineri TaxID=433720 RepID=A0A819FZ68_9BILA|nr:unnamed protein product [Adineta steineri]CAF1428554.1 unnamed protein product [Adineta steineri]CAF3787941.1 unnamed protein product [Adineta steineri]CAF3873763.1 unnamed protein product [Adineta steineri]
MNSTNDTNPGLTLLFDYKLKLVEQIVLGTIFISALIGNTIVLVILLNKKNRHITRMAFFILHLTIADLLVAFFSVLPMLIWKSTITFFGGDFLCRIVSFLMLTVSYISVYTLVVMANDRYQAIVHPLSTYTWTYRSGLIHMIGVWCLSLLLASPQLFIFRLAYHPAYQKKTCMASFFGSNRTWELIYIAWTIFVQFLLPICILIFCYSSVYIIVNRNISMYRSTDNLKRKNFTKLLPTRMSKRSDNIPTSTTIPRIPPKEVVNNHLHIHYPSVECTSITTVTFLNKPSSHNIRDKMYPIVFRLRRSPLDITKNQSTNSIDGQKSQQRHGANHFLSRARLKTIKLTFIVVLTYILCSTPFYIGSIIMTLHEKFISQKTMNWLMTIFSLLFNLNSCSNPIICLTLSGTLLRCQNSYRQRPLPSQMRQIANCNKIKSSKLFVGL